MSAEMLSAAPSRRLPSKKLLWWIVPIVVVLVVATFLMARNPVSNAPLSPHNPKPNGARAMAKVLEQQGVSINTPKSVDELAQESFTKPTTVVVTRAELLGPKQWKQFARETAGAERIVLIDPGPSALTAYDIEADIRSGGLPFEADADCATPLVDGLTLLPSGQRYSITSDGSGLTTCFPPGGEYDAGGDKSGSMLIAAPSENRPEVIVVGTKNVLRNADVLEADNAAVGLRVLGGHGNLVWWNATAVDMDRSQAAPPRWPTWFGPLWWIAFGVVILLMIARGRRLGRLITEPLPVVVRADETTRARGQLYRKSGDLDRASRVLRAATRARLGTYLQVRPDDPTLAAVVADASQRTDPEIHTLLAGPTPRSEAELTDLAQQLHALEREIRP